MKAEGFDQGQGQVPPPPLCRDTLLLGCTWGGARRRGRASLPPWGASGGGERGGEGDA